jgi:hypothetical protein
MKKPLFLIIFLLGAIHSRAQEIEDINKLVLLKKYDKARPEIDKFLANPANAAKAEAWFYKCVTYNNLARAAGKAIAESKSLNLEAYAAVKKYLELDPKATLTNNDSNSIIYNMYYTMYDLGVKMYNDKSYEESYDLFKNTLDIHDYIYGQKLYGPGTLRFSAHDTDIVWNLAILANELKKKDELIVYYRKIADADLGADKYVDAYDELVKKYKKEENKELFAKYLEGAKKHYPADKAYWEALGIEFTVKGLENEALFKKYEELMQTYPDNYMLNYNFGHELDKYVYSGDSKGKDVSAYRKKIPELYKKAIAINSTVEANVLLTNYYYNSSFDLIDEAQKIKGTKPEDVKKRTDLMTQSKATLAQTIPCGEEAVKLYAALKQYKSSDKVNYKQVLDILSTAYKQTGNAAKADEYEKKKAEVDKL